jgi:hypothetical protein
MVNNSININKTNNHLSSPENTEHKKTLFVDGNPVTGLRQTKSVAV